MSFACAPNPGRVVLDVPLLANTLQALVNVAALPGYIAGMTDVNILVGAGVRLYSNDTTQGALRITGATANDRILLRNKGFILGMGGFGGTVQSNGVALFQTSPTDGGPGLVCDGVAVEVDNTEGIIAGGGGGGGGAGVPDANAPSSVLAAGGGGAGGGQGGAVRGTIVVDGQVNALGGAGGVLLAAGGAGQATTANVVYCAAGGGGRIFPGTQVLGVTDNMDGVTRVPSGGSAGGAGGAAHSDFAGSGTHFRAAGGGGGGWGADGGTSCYTNIDSSSGQLPVGGLGGAAGQAGGNGAIPAGTAPVYPLMNGGLGGKAIKLVNGGARTIFAGADRMYGATS